MVSLIYWNALQLSKQARIKFRYNSMSLQIRSKNRVQFRCRPVRSSSLSTKLNTKQQCASQVKQKKKVVLHVPKKRLTLDKRKVSIPINDQNDLNLVSLQSIRSKDIESQDQCDNQFDSKATMKKKVSLNQSQHQQLKCMLIQLADSHQEMMSILKQIVKKQCYSGTERVHSHKIEQHEKLKHVYSSLNKEKLKISRVLNEVIDGKFHYKHETNSNEIIKVQKKSQKTDIFGSMLPSYVANMLVEVLSEKASTFHTFFSAQIDLRQLISLRFQAHNLNYNFFLGTLLNIPQKFISSEELDKILFDHPFRLQNDQICILKKTIFQKNWQSQKFKISQLAQKMRCFVQDRPLLDPNYVKIKLLHLNTVLQSKKLQICQSIKRIQGETECINIKTVQKVLKQYRFQDVQIQILISKLSLVSNSIHQLEYNKLFDIKWIQSF